VSDGQRLTRRQAAIIGLYTGTLCGPFSDLHKYAEEVAGRSVFTHELGDSGVADMLKAACKDDFLALVATEVETTGQHA